MLLINHVIL
jgi:squalene cyclase